MSRIVIKNLPKQITQDELRKHFSIKGRITDVRLIYKNGEFRRYAFIGFEEESCGVAARNYFHNTFIKQAKITVEMCYNLGSGQNQPTQSEKNKKVKGKICDSLSSTDIKTDFKEKDKPLERKEFPEHYKDDPSFGEFLKASEGRLEDDGELAVFAMKKENNSKGQDQEVEKEDKLANKSNVSDEDYLKSLMKAQSTNEDNMEARTNKKPKEKKEFYTVVIRATEMCKGKQNNARIFTKKGIKDFMKPLKFKSLRIPKKTKMVAYVGFETEKDMKQSLQKDKSFIDGVRVHIVKYNKISSVSKNQEVKKPWNIKEEEFKHAEPIAESGKLFIRNLWYSVTEEDLQELFKTYGEITDVSLPICKYTRRCKGFGTITFLFPEHAVKAMSELDGTNFKGRILHILPAMEPKTDNEKNEKLSFKDKKAQERKIMASSWHNWNTLFMGSNAVVDVMAEKYNRSKQAILESEGKQSVAVNLALGETQVVEETKSFLEDNGVSLDAFSHPGVQRSKTIFLVKNLPAKTTAQELKALFSKFGEIGRVILPPSGVTGIVEFLNAGEAKTAFRNLAYSKFKSSPLYLEWAPFQVFKTEFVSKSSDGHQETEVHEKDADETEKQEHKSEDSYSSPEPDTTIYVKNLNFSTTENELKQHFERIGIISSVLIAKRRGESQGYGFIQFLRRRDAQKALREMNESTLEKHKLQIKMSGKTLSTAVKSTRKMQDGGKQTSSKLLVKNIPFQATHQEVKQLFGTFGQLKSVRLPQKPGSNEHRGFGFVDFVSKEDAKKAFDALGLSTHLYDRRLVLEWAKENETVEELRKRTAEQFLRGGSNKKKAKIQIESKIKEDSENE